MLENIVRRLKLPQDKVYMNLQRVGNTVSASIPIALKDAASEGLTKARCACHGGWLRCRLFLGRVPAELGG